jgi:hypothetical protein
LHPVETSHVWRVFYFRRMQNFYANSRPGPGGPPRRPAAARRAGLNGTTPPSSNGIAAQHAKVP